MKQCFSCQEQVGDKFSFCPVCGSPLQAADSAPATTNAFAADTAPVAPPPPAESYFTVEAPSAIEPQSAVEPPATIETPSIMADTAAVNRTADVSPFTTGAILSVDGAGTEPVGGGLSDEQLAAVGGDLSNYIHDDGEYHLTFLDDSGLVSRLTGEVRGVAKQSQLTWPEFKRDPIGFFKRSATGYGRMAGGFFGNRYISIALAAAMLVLLAIAGTVVIVDKTRVGGSSRVGMSLFAIGAFALLSAILISWLSRGNSTVVIGGEQRDKTAATVGVSVAMGLPLILIAVLVFFIFYGQRRRVDPNNPNADLTLENVVDIPDTQPTPDPGNAGRDKGTGGGSKAKQEKPSGGGGGGREEQTPASQGKLPTASLDVPIIVAPNPKPPPPTSDPLVVPPTMDADPTLFPPDKSSANFGDPNSKSTVPSSGPGSGNGIGNGTGGGVGSGNGGGNGPGNGGNTGGGDRNIGGGGPGGGGGGTDYNKVFRPGEVTQKARIISKPAPEYTEEARVNQTMGVVRLSAVLTSSGQVTNIKPLNNLPYGLTEKAVAACRRIQFSPAVKDGRPVSQYVTIEYNFNIY